MFGEKTMPTSTEPINYRFYLPGSLSQIVLHAAPGYDPLPEPCSLVCDDIDYSLNAVEGTTTHSDSYEVDDADSVSGSLNEESAYSDSSQDPITGSSGIDGGASGSEGDQDDGSFINFSDVANANRNQSGNDFAELMSKKALESWLDENPGSSKNASEKSYIQRSSARISIGDIGGRVKPKSNTLLDPVNGNGLRVDYMFSSEISSISPLLVCVEVTLTNCSAEHKSKLSLCDEDTQKSLDSSDQELATTARLF